MSRRIVLCTNYISTWIFFCTDVPYLRGKRNVLGTSTVFVLSSAIYDSKLATKVCVIFRARS
ncbi:unnamed protein product [Brassica oleracea]